MNEHNIGVLVSLFLIVMLAGIYVATYNQGTQEIPTLRDATNHNLVTTLEAPGIIQITYDTVNPDGSYTTHFERTSRRT